MTATLVESLREAGQDFEWYPTTDAMIEIVAAHMRNRDPYGHNHVTSLLDIGAGDGRVLQALAGDKSPKLYAIEKAEIHIQNMPADIAIVGTDFHYQTLIDKDVDVIFCNPPYSEFEDWAVKIIKEALCNHIYLILPQRWIDSAMIKDALIMRDSKPEIIWTGDFSVADRPARAQVNILHVDMRKRYSEYGGRNYRFRQISRDKPDPFDTWFQENFPEVEAIDKQDGAQETAEKRIQRELVPGPNLVERLCELYQRDMDRMNESYKALCAIDPVLLKEVGVKSEEVKEGLKKKIGGLKNLYWKELFEHLEKIKRRLTHKSCDKIVDQMGLAVHVDFTADNAYAVVLWVLKNANSYIEGQVVDLFTELTEPECVKMYKSNQKTFGNDDWRYLKNEHWSDRPKEKPTHYMLDYRIVASGWYGHAIKPNDKEWRSDYDYPGGLHRDAHARLDDIVTIANNLEFPCSDSSRLTYRRWTSGSAEVLYLDNGEPLVRVRAFMNGNMHYQFNQDFIKALNVEASRILGWIRSPQEACAEMDIDIVTATRCFASNKLFVADSRKLLTA